MVRITPDPIDPRNAFAMVSPENAGSLLFHYAVVKSKGGVTSHIDYSVVGDAEEELATIAGEISGAWSIGDIVLVRRIGRVGIGEIISLVAISSPSSEDAFAACKFAISRLKQMHCIAKNEVCS